MRIRYLLTLCLLAMPLAAFAVPVPWHESTNFHASVAIGKPIVQAHNADYRWLYAPSDPLVSNILLNKAKQGNDDGYGWFRAVVKSLRGYFYQQSSAPWGESHGGNKPGIVSEPGTLVLFGVGLLGLGLARHRISH